MNTTSISWTEKTWNPISGCTPISEGCANCYAKRMAQRLRGRCGYPADEPFRVTLHEDKLNEPLRMRKPARVFVASMGDLFHEDVPDEFIDKVFAVMALAPQHTYMVLTKRPERMRDYLSANNVDEPSISGREALCLRLMRTAKSIDAVAYERLGADAFHWHPEAWPQVWLGVTAENQARADERIPLLLQTPAAVRFVSVEPMLGPVDLRHLHYQGITEIDALAGTHGLIRPHGGKCANLDWVICGGETSAKARPMHPDWVRGLRDQCQTAPVPFHFKGWGEWGPECTATACRCQGITDNGSIREHGDKHSVTLFRVGPKAAGRLLDSKEWDEYPEVRSGD